MPVNWDGFIWLLVLLGPVLLFQRKLHRELQSVFLLLTRNREISLLIFSFIFLPGVLLHELSHFLMARLLQVRTGRFSLIPQTLEDGRLQLGYVETARTDMVRDALIGAAPLLAGGLFVTFAGLSRLQLDLLWQEAVASSGRGLWAGLQLVHQQPDFWLWFYLTFAVSSTMLPSASDRKAWKPLTLILGLLFAFSLAAGAGPWLVQTVMPYFNQGLRVIALIFGISLAVHLVFLIPVWGLRLWISRLTRLEVV
jgi:hypothetical protein